MITRLLDAIKGKAPLSAKRSSKWPSVREQFLKMNPACAVCGSKEKLEVHHIQPFHLHPELELSLDNLITLCESGSNGVVCHLLFGHLGNYKAVNPFVRSDSMIWHKKIAERTASQATESD